MKRLFVFGLAFAAMASAALAQQPPAPPEQMAPAASQDHAPPPPSAGPDAIARPDDLSSHDHAGAQKDGSRPDMALYRHHRQMPPPPSKAAHFRVENGDTKIDIKCADDEPTKVCAEVLLQLIDKLAAPADSTDDQRD